MGQWVAISRQLSKTRGMNQLKVLLNAYQVRDPPSRLYVELSLVVKTVKFVGKKYDNKTGMKKHLWDFAWKILKYVNDDDDS